MPKKKTWEEIVEKFEQRNFLMLSKKEDYINKNTKLTCMDEDGYLYSLSYDVVRDERTQKFSPIEKRNKYSIKNIQHWIELLGSESIVLSKEYIDEKSPITILCECGETYQSFWNRMSNIKKCRCNKCGVNDRIHARSLTIDEISKEVNSYGYILLDDYVNNIKSINIMDKNGNKYKANLFFLRHGGLYGSEYGCQSSLERKTKDYLNEKNVDFVMQKTFDDCKNIHKLRFDFYLPKYNCVIETHGEQHYKDSTDFFKVSLDEQQKRDKYKQEYCELNGIKYYVIPYWEFDVCKNRKEKYKETINKILE